MTRQFWSVLTLSLLVVCGISCVSDDDADSTTESGVASADAGDDVDTVDCTDSDSCDCTDFHDDMDGCEDAGCKPRTLSEYDVDKIYDEISDSDKRCSDVDDRVVEQHDFCLDKAWISENQMVAEYSRYDDDSDRWRVFSSQTPILPDGLEELDMVECSEADDDRAQEICGSC